MKKYIVAILAFCVAILSVPQSRGSLGTLLDSVTVGGYLYPKTSGLSLGSTTNRWSVYASAINTSLGSGAMYSNSGVLAVDTNVSATELGYLDGVTSAIQTQIDGKQSTDAELSALAGLTSAADKGIQFTGSGTAGTYDLTAAGKALLDDANASAQRTTLGVAIGSDVQAYDAELAALAGLTSAADKGIQFTGSGTAGTYDLTTAGKALLDDASASAQRTTLGLNATTSAISSTDIDWSTLYASGGLYTKTLSANTTFTFSNRTAGQTIVVRLTNTASNYTVTWPTVAWCNDDAAPTMTTGAKMDIYTFIYDGTDVFGCYTQNHHN